MASEEVDVTRLPWETADQYSLRWAFIQRNAAELPRDRLLSLAQMFINIEFLGCSYSHELMETVANLSEGLTEEFRQRRKAVVVQTFGDDDEKAPKRRRPTQRAADFDGMRVSEQPTNPLLPSAKRRRDDVEEISAKPPDLLRVEKSLELFRAQLSVAPRGLDPLALVNHVSKRSKAPWTIEFGYADALLCVAGVVVVRCAFDGDQMATRAAACAAAAERLSAPHLDVRTEARGEAEARPLLYSRRGLHEEWQSVDGAFVAAVETSLGRVRDALEADSRRSLQQACAAVGVHFDLEEKQLTGWNQRLSVVVGGVRVHSEQLRGAKALSRERRDENVGRATLAAAEKLRCPFHRVFEDAEAQLTALTSHAPVPDGLITAELARHTEQDDSADEQSPYPLPLTLVARFILLRAQDRNNATATDAKSLLLCSSQFSKVPVRFACAQHPTDIEWRCTVFVDGQRVGEGDGSTEKLSTWAAAGDALANLIRQCYTIICKGGVDPSVGEVDATSLINDAPSSADSVEINESNIGNRLLKKMGWAGGGIGKNAQGRSQPVTSEMIIGRQGLGVVGASQQFHEAVRGFLEEYAASNDQDDVVFAASLSNPERLAVHRIAGHLGLKSLSYGPKSDRQLTVQRRRNALQLLQLLIECGGENGKYVLKPPSTSGE